MKILIDATVLTDNFRFRGVGKLALSLIRELLEHKDIEWQLMAPGKKSDLMHYLAIAGDIESIPNFHFISLGNGGGLNKKLHIPSYFNLKVLPKILKAKPDIFLSLNPENGLPIGKVKTLAFVHDITPLRTGVYSQKNPLANFIKGKNYNWAINKAKMADQVLTISEFTKSDLVKSGFDEGKITVVPLAVSESFRAEVKSLEKHGEDEDRLKRRVLNIYNITEPYICYVGGLEANKNVDQVLKTFAQINEKYPNLKLVIGGSEFKLGWDHKATPLNERALRIYNLAKELKILHKIIFTGFIEEQHLPVILKCAKVFIHLSKYEGFGLAVLEPQMMGTPVLASNLTSYPEVLGDSAILVDADDTEKIADQLNKLLSEDDDSEKLRKDLTKKGFTNVKRFSWEKSAQIVIEAAKKLISESKKELEIKKNKTQLDEKIPTGNITNQNKIKKAVILAAYFHPFVGGMEKVALDYAGFLAKIGFEVTVLTSDRKNGQIVVKKEEDYTDKIKIVRLKRSGKNYYFYRLKDLSKKLKEIKPDLIHSHGFGFLAHDIALWKYKKLVNRKVKIIATPHGPFMSKPEKGLRQVAKIGFNFIQSLYLNRILDKVISENPYQNKWIHETYGIDEGKIVMLPPVMPQPHKSFKELEKIKKKKDYIQITSISRLADYKGFDDIITAFNEINTATSSKLIIAGKTDNYTEEIEKLINNSPRREDISLEKDISDERRDEILEQTDLFVFGSQWEAFGIVIAEAMANACAIISTDTEGGMFLVKPGENGLLYKYREVSKLVGRIDNLLNNSKLLGKMKYSGYHQVEKYSEKIMHSKFADLIHQLFN